MKTIKQDKFYRQGQGGPPWEGEAESETWKIGRNIHRRIWGKNIRAERTASAKALRWGCDWHVWGTARRHMWLDPSKGDNRKRWGQRSNRQTVQGPVGQRENLGFWSEWGGSQGGVLSRLTDQLETSVVDWSEVSNGRTRRWQVKEVTVAGGLVGWERVQI